MFVLDHCHDASFAGKHLSEPERDVVMPRFHTIVASAIVVEGRRRVDIGCRAEWVDVRSDDEEHFIDDESRRERWRKAERVDVILPSIFHCHCGSLACVSVRRSLLLFYVSSSYWFIVLSFLYVRGVVNLKSLSEIDL